MMASVTSLVHQSSRPSSSLMDFLPFPSPAAAAATDASSDQAASEPQPQSAAAAATQESGVAANPVEARCRQALARRDETWAQLQRQADENEEEDVTYEPERQMLWRGAKFMRQRPTPAASNVPDDNDGDADCDDTSDDDSDDDDDDDTAVDADSYNEVNEDESVDDDDDDLPVKLEEIEFLNDGISELIHQEKEKSSPDSRMVEYLSNVSSKVSSCVEDLRRTETTEQPLPLVPMDVTFMSSHVRGLRKGIADANEEMEATYSEMKVKFSAADTLRKSIEAKHFAAETKRLEADELDNEVEHLKRAEEYLPDPKFNSLRCNLRRLERLLAERDVPRARLASALQCVVCLDVPRGEILACLRCENLLCRGCFDRIAQQGTTVCPACKWDLEESPPKRSHLAERLVREMY